MFAIAWQYLNGRVTAADPADRTRAEWPPHPDRVFQALVAAWGETGATAAGRAALEWLETQPPPALAAPSEDSVARATTSVFVPVNDVEGPTKGDYFWGKHEKILPAHRPRKARHFATVHVGAAVCALVWAESEAPPVIAETLARLCAAVTHVGHSRSLVRMWLAAQPPAPTWMPCESRGEMTLRVPHAGRLQRLIVAFDAGGPRWQRPPVAPWQGYRRAAAPAAAEAVAVTPFDPRLIVLRRVGGEGTPGVSQAPRYVARLRAALMSRADARAMPWLSGHAADGTPLDRPHVAILPLPFVGHAHADGHLLGLALALPRDLTPADEQAVLETLGGLIEPGTDRLRVNCGAAGVMLLTEETGPAPAFSLRAETWTRPATQWATVTPIALDRLPPRRHVNDDAWLADQIVAACLKQGLPEPCALTSLPVSAHIGAPPCRAFPPLLRKPDGARRWHTHAVLSFRKPVRGPLLLGAGRYRGYGLCKPLATAWSVAPGDAQPVARQTEFGHEQESTL